MSNHNPLTLKLNLREKIAYGMGDVGSGDAANLLI